MKFSALLFFMIFSSVTVMAQTKRVQNAEGQYSITAPSDWAINIEGSVTDAYSPEEGKEDLWQEYLGISTGDANGLTLQQAFDYYIKIDFPGYYPEFRVLETGKETINGMTALWTLCSYGASGNVNNLTQSAVIYNLFYLFLKDDTLYFLHGIAVDTEYPRFDESFRQIIRSFSVSR
jgi:hypothetical protein